MSVKIPYPRIKNLPMDTQLKMAKKGIPLKTQRLIGLLMFIGDGRLVTGATVWHRCEKARELFYLKKVIPKSPHPEIRLALDVGMPFYQLTKKSQKLLSMVEEK